MRLLPFTLLCPLAWTLPVPSAAQEPQLESFDSTWVDSARVLYLRTHDQRTIRIQPDSDQVGVDQVAISPDRHAVGWLVLYPNCCTSYPIPFVLDVYARGSIHPFRGNELPVWQWDFEGGGTQVAFYQATVHGGGGRHFELRDVVSGELLGTYDPTDSTTAPPWVGRL